MIEEYAKLSEEIYRIRIKEQNIINDYAASLITDSDLDGEAAKILASKRYGEENKEQFEKDVETVAKFERETGRLQAIIAKAHEGHIDFYDSFDYKKEETVNA
jgi:hypothetical protein